MKSNGKTYLILGVVFLAIGITMLMTGAVSKTMAYGDLVFAAVFFVFASRAKEGPEDSKVLFCALTESPFTQSSRYVKKEFFI